MMTADVAWQTVMAVMGVVVCLYLWRTLRTEDRTTCRLKRTYSVPKRVILPLVKRLPYTSKKYRTYAERIAADDTDDMK